MTSNGNANAPAPREGGAVSAADIARAMQEDAGRGISTAPQDNIIPQIRIMQPLSPEVLDGVDRVDGARPGDFLAGSQIVPGQQGIWFQPCAFTQQWFEFVPRDRGGGFVTTYPFSGEDRPPPGTVPNGRFKHLNPENGNDVTHWRQLAGVLWRGPGDGLEYVISFRGSGHTTARQWNTEAGRINRQEVGGEVRARPLFGHVWKLTTSSRRNALGQWYAVDYGHPVCLDPAVGQLEEIARVVGDPGRAYFMGRALARAFESGEKVAAQAEEYDED